MKSIPFYLLLLIPGLVLSQPGGTPVSEVVSVITIKKPEFRILSDAYTRLQPISVTPLQIDTTRFDERYEDFDYCRITPKNLSPVSGKIRNAYFTVKLVRNRIDSNVCFTFSMKPGIAESESRFYISVNNHINIVNLIPEMRAYRSYDWILADAYTRREFRRLMRGKRWYDMRIYYEPEDDLYTLTLKGPDDTIDLRVYPVRNNRIVPEALRRPDPAKLFKQYDKMLSRLRKRFDARIDRQVKSWQQTNRQHRLFLEKYYSDEERAMTQEEWMEYVRKVLENEMQYLPDAPFYPILLARYLRYQGFEQRMGDGYNEQTPARCKLNHDSLTRQIREVLFLDKSGMLAVNQTNISFDTPETFTTTFRPRKNRVAVFYLKDGTLALATEFTYDDTRNEYTFLTETFDPGIITIRVVADYLGL